MLNGYIPQDKPEIIIVDYRISLEIEEKLKELTGARIIRNPKSAFLYEEISGHPDIVLLPLNSKSLVCAPHLYEHYENILSQHEISVICGKTKISGSYPADVAYNICLFSNKSIQNINHADDIALSVLDEKKAKKLHVKQGYSKCSICIVDENSIITSDRKIHETCLSNGIDSLLISHTGVFLSESMDGFIGGSSITLSDSILFFGDIRKHPDYESIYSFISRKNKSIVSLSPQKLSDYGSAIVL